MGRGAPPNNGTFDEAGTAGVAMPYGSPVRRGKGGRLYPLRIKVDWQGAPVPAEGYDGVLEMVGVIRIREDIRRERRKDLPQYCGEGEIVELRTEGHIMAVDGDGMTISLNLRHGRAM